MDKKRAMSFTVRLIIAVVLSLLLVGGGTFAYWRWVSSTSKNVVFSTVDNIEDYINYDAGNSYFVGDFQPTSSFCQSTHTTLSFSKKELGKDHKFVATIHMDVNAIGDSIKNSSSVHWVVTTGDDNISCTQGLDSPYVINHGTFQGKSAGTSFALTDDVDLLLSMSEKKFTVWIWLDSRGSDLQSLTGQTIDTNVWTQIDMLDNMYSAKENTVGDAYAIYSETDSSLRFYRSEEPIVVGTTYNDRVVTEVYTGFEDEVYDAITDVPWAGKAIATVIVEDSIYPISTAYWFAWSKANNFNLIKLNTDLVTDMSAMFNGAGGLTETSFNITGMENWDTSNVTDMHGMFGSIGAWNENNMSIDLGDISGWNVSNVINMEMMFYCIGDEGLPATFGDISGWDVSNVVNMDSMLDGVHLSQNIDLSGWDVSNVEQFHSFCYFINDDIKSPVWVNGTAYAVYSSDDTSLRFYRDSGTITEGSSYRGREATIVYTGFEDASYAGASSVPWASIRQDVTTVVVEDEIRPVSTAYWFSNFNFAGFGVGPTFELQNLNTSNVTDMRYMFEFANATQSITGMEHWDTSKVTNMSNMFINVGADVGGVFNISDISGWNVSKVTDMRYMFDSIGLSSTNNWTLDLSRWDVSKVTSYTEFNISAEDHIIPPAKFSS